MPEVSPSAGPCPVRRLRAGSPVRRAAEGWRPHRASGASRSRSSTLLLERPGDLVTRDELRQRLWPDGTFVDFDHGLNAVINRLRDTLGDSADTPRFVETVPRRGYRFIAPVDKGLQDGSAAHPRPTWWHPRRLMWPAVVTALAIGAAVSLYVFRLRPFSRASDANLATDQSSWPGTLPKFFT